MMIAEEAGSSHGPSSATNISQKFMLQQELTKTSAATPAVMGEMMGKIKQKQMKPRELPWSSFPMQKAQLSMPLSSHMATGFFY